MNSCRFFHVLVAGLLGSLCIPTARAATFNVTGTTLAIDLTAASESVAITAGATNYSFVLTGGTWSGTDSADATGNGTATLSALKASFTAVTVDDGSTGNAVNFNDSGANTYSSNFTVKIDSASPAASNFAGATPFAGNAALFVQAGPINCNPGTVISTVDGNLSILGNMQTPGLTGNLFGIFVSDAQIKVTGSGNLTLKGTSGISTSTVSGVRISGASIITGGIAGSTLTVEGYGAASSTRNYGVNISGTGSITSLGGDVVVTGVGGSGAATENKGVLLEAFTSILATGSGSISVTGTGGGANTAQNSGVELLNGAQIASVNGNVSVTGTGGGAGTGGTNRGVVVSGSIKSTGSGNVSVTGAGGPGSGGDNQGVLMERNGTGTVQEIKSGTGNVTVTGTAGGGSGSLGIKVNSVAAAAATISTGSPGSISLLADSMSLVTSAVISAPTVSIASLTAGKNMDLGSSSDTIPNTLALSQAELNTITADTLNLGDANTTALNLSANLTRPAGTTTNLTAAIFNLNGFTLTGGTVNQFLNNQPVINLEQPVGSAIMNGATQAFGAGQVGGSTDLVFTVRNTGSGDLTGISLSGLSGTDFSVISNPASSLAPAGSTTFTIRFSASSLGLKSATLNLASNALGAPSFVMNLTGAGTLPLGGTRTVGPTGDYASLTAAIGAIQANNGPTSPLILELQPAYLSTVETFPLVFTNLATTATNTLTIRPASEAVNLSISSATTTAATVDLNGAQFVIIDGRPGGVGSHAGSGGGTATQLSIANTDTNGVALRFMNEASRNTIRYTTFRGVGTYAGSGVVVFGTTTGANGNDNNSLDHCDLGDGASMPTNCLFSLGTATTIDQYNSGNTVSNCNIFNFYSTVANTAGLLLDEGNTDWSITGNSFYQTASLGPLVNGMVHHAIRLWSPSGGNFTVTGNFIGGSAANAGGTAWTKNSQFLGMFLGIYLKVGTTTPSSVQGNTIANMIWASNASGSALSSAWCGIFVAAGNVNIGTVTGNTIGSGTGTNSISVSTSGQGGTCFGIGSLSTGTVVISNNTIGAITMNGSDTTVSASITGIQVNDGTNTISNNLVGSTTTANSLNAANVSTSATGQRVIGIYSNSIGLSNISANITGNTVANLNNNYAGTSIDGTTRGIITSNATITGNTVRNLASTSQNPNANLGQSVMGITVVSTLAGQTISQNTVHSLSNTADAAAVNVTGIYFSGPTSGTNVVERNFVHSLALSSSSLSSQLFGIYFANGPFTAQNNMVRVGLKADGTSTAGASIIYGIVDNGSTAGRNFYHNTVYLGGTQTAGAGTQAFQSFGTGNARTYQNNIFVNARSNSGATARHNAVIYGGTGVNPTGLTAGGNIFVASGIGGAFGFYNNANVATLAAWQAATGQDATSAVIAPPLVNPDGDASTVDLHVSANNPAENGGTVLTDSLTGAIVTLADDFDGETRSTLTPTDVGADAGNFTLSPGDVFAPRISYPLLMSGTTANRVLTNWATIADNSGSVEGGASAPRLYFRKSTNADVFGVANDATGNGWKFVTATGSSPYSFTLDYGLLPGGANRNDTIEYFVVAQDAANNLSSSPMVATASANPPVQNVNSHGATNTFRIFATPVGTMSVGPTGDYLSVNNAISAIQGVGISGPVILELQPSYVSTVETFPLVFTNLGTTATNTLTIRPAVGAVNLSISSADTTAATVDLNGAQFVTIDGRPGGVGSHAGSGGGNASQLTIENTSTSGAAVRFINEASSNTLRYLSIQGVNANANSGNVVFGTTTGTNGNDTNTIDHCDIGDGASTPANGIYSSGTAAPADNSGNTVTYCNIFNFYRNIDAAGLRLDGGNTDWSINGNSFYQTTSRTAVGANVRAIYINNASGNNFTVTGNFIGGSAANAGGTPWATTGNTAAYLFQGIALNVDTTTPSSVQGNTIANMVWTSSSNATTLPGLWSGIYVQAGSANIGTSTGNTIGSGTGTGSISVTTSGTGGTSFGIAAAGTGTRVIANNTVGSITTNGSSSTVSASLTGISVTAGANTISYNTVGSTTTVNSLNASTSSTSTTGQQVTGILSSSTASAIITGNTVANLNNNYAATGTGSGTAGQIRGIVTSAGVNTITGNTVRNLSTTSTNANPTTTQSVYGIIATSTAAGQTVSQNTVHSLANTAASGNVNVTGIYFAAGNTSTGHVIARNFVHSPAVSSSSATSVLNGMQFVAGNFTAQNNLVRVGLDASGSRTAGASIVRGLYDNGNTAGRNFYHNSVFVGGTRTSGTANSFAFISTGATNVRTFQNNIFVNARSNAGGTGKHYAVQYGGTTVNPTGLTAGGNLFLASGTGGVFGLYNATDRSDLAAWQAATGQDATSYNVDPRFINPTGTDAMVDLHLQTVNPAEAHGVAGTGVTDDFDGQPRSDYTAVDIGADTGNFIYAGGSSELNPLISFTPAANITRTATRVLSAFATITDDGAIATGPDAPRLYFKKSSEANAFGANTSAANGWKYVTAINAGSPYDFTIDYSLLTSSLSIGDVIQYFIVAQDSTGNFASSPSGAAYSSAAAPVTTVNARPASVASYTLLTDPPTFSGYSLTTKKNTSASIGLAKLLARAADPDGGMPAISAVSTTTSQGGSVSLSTSSVTYTPANNFTGLDTFTVTIIDGQGGSLVGTVTVNVSDATAASGNQASQIVLQPGGEVSVLFFGIPGQVYQIQRSTDMSTWTFLQNATAAADGSISFTDPSPPPGAGFYRTVVP